MTDLDTADQAPSGSVAMDAKIDAALATRAFAAVCAYTCLFFILGWVTEAFAAFPVAIRALSVWILALGGTRIYLARAAALRAREPKRWALWFRVTTVLAGATWGTCCALCTHVMGFKVVLLVTTAGMTAGAVTSLGLSVRLARAYIGCMLGPTIAAVALWGTHSKVELTFAVILLLYFAFLSIEARHVHDAFVTEIEHTFLLDVRAVALAERTASMRLVLDTVGQGFVKVGLDGSLAADRSAILTTWFGPAGEGEQVWDYLARSTSLAAAWFALAWEELGSSALPLEVVLDQLPRQISSADRFFDLEYRPIVEGGAPSFLLIVSDATHAVEHARRDEERRETLAVFEHVQSDRSGFLAFMKDSESLIRLLCASPVGESDADRRRWLHTLKGTSSMYGLLRFSRRCHELEDELEAGARLTDVRARGLAGAWEESTAPLKVIIQERPGMVEITEGELTELRRAVVDGARPQVLLAKLDSLLLEPTSVALHRLGQQARDLAKRLSKELEVVIESHDLRLPEVNLRPIWGSLIHVIRNAVDHGLEPADARLAAGKSTRGTLRLSTSIEGDEVSLLVRDDGPGIDWEAVRDRARTMALPCSTIEELNAAVFADGLTTRSEATETSGRGVGMPSLVAAVERMGGHVSLVSETRTGTTCSVSIPLSAIFAGSAPGLSACLRAAS
ncbi:MAG: ATP-binding protein [Polyangiaceae bacterium]